MLKQTHTILAVDDESTSLLMLEKVLRPRYTVLTARSGAEALDILKREQISLLITDQRMPGMTGTELLRKGHSLRPDMVSMLITSNNDAETFIDAITRAGALRVINKPWDPANLLTVVAQSLKAYENFVERKDSSDRLKQIQEKLDKIAKLA